MISYFLGIPGSGKTYYAVNTIFNNFCDDPESKLDLKKDYHNCYTNINEFDFDAVHDVFPLDFDKFYKDLERLYNMYKRKATDEELIVKAKEFNIYRTLFVIDECHNYFDVKKPVLVWWLTYHRHLYHDIMLITQNLALVESKYKPLAEAFYRAVPLSLTFNRSYFNYRYYTDSRLTKASLVNTIKVKKKDKVFKLYHSGDSVNTKNVVMRFVIIAFIFLFIAVLGFIYFKNSFSGASDEKKNIEKIKKVKYSERDRDVQQDRKLEIHEDFNYDDKVFLSFNCSRFSCSYNNFSIPLPVLLKYIHNNSFELIYKYSVNSYMSIYYLSADKSFYNFLFRSGKNEEQNKDSDSSVTGKLFG